VETELSLAERDNSQIYHEIVPNEHQLKPPEKQSMVKILPVEKEKFVLSVDPFANLIPTSFRNADSIYSVLDSILFFALIMFVFLCLNSSFVCLFYSGFLSFFYEGTKGRNVARNPQRSRKSK
jgi:hypothetical protein